MKKKLTLAVFALAVVVAGAFLVVKNYQGSNAASLYRAVETNKSLDTRLPAGSNPVDPQGIPTGPVVTAPLSCPASGYKFVTKWGPEAVEDDQLQNPLGVAVNSSGVYVVDPAGQRIQKFSLTGVFISQWGGFGTGQGQFSGIQGIATNNAGNIYVSDISGIQKFTSNGVFISKWSIPGIVAVAVDSMGNIYGTDATGVINTTTNNHVYKFNSNGVLVAQWGSYGTGNGQFNSPRGIAVDLFGHVYVADENNNRIQKFTATGNYITQWPSPVGFAGLSVDSAGNLYVSDYVNNRIRKFSSNGVLLTEWGSYGTGNGQFYGPKALTVDANKNIYVADSGNNRIQKFSPCTPIPSVPVSITRPDLIVEDFTWTPSSPHVRVITDPTKEPTPNTNFKVTATIKNIGSATATLPRGTQISFLKNGVSYGAQQLMNPVTLPIGQTFDVDVYQSTTPNILGVSGTFGLTVRVDDYAMGTGNVFNLVDESNEVNNSLTKQITVLP
jgi:sugar lactone lactonase YvrE